MFKRGRVTGAALSALWLGLSSVAGVGCGSSEDAAQEAPKAPVLGVLELPVSLRAGDAAPADAAKVEVGQAELRVDDKTVIALEAGKVPAAERQGASIAKLHDALEAAGKGTIALHLHSGLPYETLALVLDAAASSGVRDVSFQVRKPGGSTDTGWLAVKGFQMTPRTDDVVALGAVQPHSWDELTGVWEAMHNACRAAETGSCAYVPNTPAKGGEVKVVLLAAGQGVNLNFFRVGLTPEQLAEEEKTRNAATAKAKEDLIQGRKKQTDVAEELATDSPATEALFQFRANEALEAPSALSETMKPLCGTKACGAVVSAESPTMAVRVISLIGAAFPDGVAPPVLAFEQPWTEKPKATPTPSKPAP